MPRREKYQDPMTPMEALTQRVIQLEHQVRQMQRSGPNTIHAIDKDDYIDPVQGEIAINHPGYHKPVKALDGLVYYHEDAWHGIAAVDTRFQLKIVADDRVVTLGNDQLIYIISNDLNGYELVDIDAYVTTVSSSGNLLIQVRNVTQGNVDILSTRITIQVSHFSSYTAISQPVINPLYKGVSTGDLIAIDVDSAGTGAQGLGVVVSYDPVAA